MNASPARVVATTVCHRVLSEGAYLSLALDAELKRAALADARDRALATHIAYGVLRTLEQLDAAIACHLTKPISKLDAYVHAALVVAAYQIIYSERVPASAAVNDAVTLVKAKRGDVLARFTNAVCRKLSQRFAEKKPDPGLVLPDPLARTFDESLGHERMTHWLQSARHVPPLCLRTDARAELMVRLRVAFPSADVQPGVFSPLAVVVRGVGDPRLVPGYADGAFSVQEEGSQLVALLADVCQGQRVLDVCAGHGGKTSLFATCVGASGHVVATDLHPAKLRELEAELERLHIPRGRVTTDAIDWTVGSGGLGVEFDRVIVDAPCSGLGTLTRRPELKLRFKAGNERLSDITRTQLAILTRAAECVRPGGELLYAVCSPLNNEGRSIVQAFEAAHPAFKAIAPVAELGLNSDPDHIVRIGPWQGSGKNLDISKKYQEKPEMVATPEIKNSQIAVAPMLDLYQVIRWQRS